MESLVNYGSDEESGDCNDASKNDFENVTKLQEDANYEEIGMDESSEESNNNHTDGQISREKSIETSGHRNSKDELTNSYGVSNFLLGKKLSSITEGNLGKDVNSKKSGDWEKKAETKFDKQDYNAKSGEESTTRRHSSDMEMDDGEDDLDNYETVNFQESTSDSRPKYTQKTSNFSKTRDSEETPRRKFSDNYYDSGPNLRALGEKSSLFTRNIHHHKENESDLDGGENQRSKEDRAKFKDRNSDERKREECKRKEDKESRRKDEEKWKESERDRRRDCDKHKDEKEKDRKRSPERREHGRKRSHSPDRRDRDRDHDRDRDKDKEKDRDRDRERDREKDKEKEKDRERDHRSSDRRSPKHKRSSKSPEKSWKARKLEKKTAVLNKLGIELKTDAAVEMTPRQLLGEQLKAQIQEVEAKTGVTLPTYYNPGVMNPLKYAQQIQKRKLLWGNKSNETKTNENGNQVVSTPSTVKQWEAATFKGDNDGKMTEKFKRLMGIKGDSAVGKVAPAGSKPSETKEIIQKQEEMFSNMEAQYQVARMATHTHRGVGLGFGTFQVPPR